MRDTLVLLGRLLRETLRRPAVRRLLGLALAVLVAVLVGLGRGAGGATTVTAAGLLVVGVAAFSAAASAGALLPGDRAGGRSSWLRTLAPTAATHRLAAALAGVLLPLGLALAGALVVGLAVPRFVEGAGVREARSLPLLGRPGRLAPAGPSSAAWSVAVPEGVAGQTLEIAFAPPYALADAPLVVPRVRWRLGDREGEADLAYGRPLRVEVPPGPGAAANTLEVVNLTPRTWLFAREVRLLGNARSFLLSLLAGGLFLGLAAAVVAPPAVLVSRFTSAPTAVLTGIVLALVGVLEPLLGTPSRVPAAWTEAAGARVLQIAGTLAPDLSALAVLAEPGAGRALGLADGAGLGPPLLYGLLGLALVALPWPRAWRREEAS